MSTEEERRSPSGADQASGKEGEAIDRGSAQAGEGVLRPSERPSRSPSRQLSEAAAARGFPACGEKLGGAPPGSSCSEVAEEVGLGGERRLHPPGSVPSPAGVRNSGAGGQGPEGAMQTATASILDVSRTGVIREDSNHAPKNYTGKKATVSGWLGSARHPGRFGG